MTEEKKPTVAKIVKEKGVAVKKPKQETQVALREQTPTSSVDVMIEKAIEKGITPETLEKFYKMRKEMKADWAKEQFDKAMAEFQGDCPVIAKKKQGHNSKYAPLDDIVSQVRHLLKQCGFSYRIEADMQGDIVTATCIAIHKDGHSEKSSFTAKVEKVMSKTGAAVRTEMQDSAASLTFAKRYAFCNAFGIMTGDEDNEKAMGGQKQDAVVEEDEIENAKKLLDKCKTLREFSFVWNAFSKNIKVNTDILKHANFIKSNIENENSQH